MKKKIFLILGGGAMMLLLLACSTTQQPPKKIGMPNPASEYCIQQGGKLDMKKDANGNSYSNCILPDGRVIEEWQLFRQDHPAK
ncbi:putative hemolysin [Acinetobacter ihumii]|uniref:putative hemolysin n=1 Tax=Acinetobacter ihumii TaxID=2483802 RepID=UPI0010321775|nr:DUF333 domain-containing protein [Acinetobacter ihumii]